MKQTFLKIFTSVLAVLVLASCGNPKKMAQAPEEIGLQCNPEVLVVVADKITANVSATFPDGYFNPKAVLEVVPVLVYEGGEVVGNAAMFQGEKVTENYSVVPKTGATVSIPVGFEYVKGMEKSHLELRVSVYNKETKYDFPAPYKVADGANTTYKLVKTVGEFAYAPDAYQAIIPEQSEAQINYLINSAAVRPAQLKSEEITDFKAFLEKVEADERRVVTDAKILAYASPEGKEDFNDRLSQRRAESAQKAFNSKISKNAPVETVEVNSFGEDWDGFKALVEKSDIQDKELILRVLDMYNDPNVREKELRNMSKVFTVLANEVLPQLRRARFITNVEFTNYSNDELKVLVGENIEMLDEEALLRVGTLVDVNTKITVYQKAVEKYNSDRGMHNLAVAYLAANKVADAKATLNKVKSKDAYYYNTLGIIELREGKNDAAFATLSKSSLKEAKYNQGAIDIINGKYQDAVNKLAGSGSCNEPLAFILVNDLNKAEKAIGEGECPRCFYMKAIIAARKGNQNDVTTNLQKAFPAFKERAAKDVEFAKFNIPS